MPVRQRCGPLKKVMNGEVVMMCRGPRTRDEHDGVAFLNLVIELALKLPVCVVDENEDAWAAGMAWGDTGVGISTCRQACQVCL